MNRFGITLPNWMKWLVLCLTVSTTAGYLIGLQNSKQGLSTILLKNVEARRSEESILLFYTCNGKDLYSYDVDSHNLQDLSYNLFGEPETFVQTTYKYAIGFLSGTGLTVYKFASPIMDSMGISNAEKWKYFVVGIIAGGSGLYVGYQIGSWDLPSCDDEKIKVKLQENNYWKQSLAGAFANELLNQAYLLAVKSAIPFTNGPDIKKRILSGRIDSGLFRTLLTDIEERHEKLNPD